MTNKLIRVSDNLMISSEEIKRIKLVRDTVVVTDKDNLNHKTQFEDLFKAKEAFDELYKKISALSLS